MRGLVRRALIITPASLVEQCADEWNCLVHVRCDPAAAFRKYADDLMAESAVSTVSVLPGELCGYSGQKLMGAWSDTPQNAVGYEDRIAHIWTNSGTNYLVAVHVQAPTGTPGFDAAAALLTEDFEILLP